MTIKEMVQYYLCAKINNPRTEENYLSISRRFNECCPHSSIKEIDFMHIKKWKDTVLEQASTTTWNTYLRHMKAIFNFALKKNNRYQPF